MSICECRMCIFCESLHCTDLGLLNIACAQYSTYSYCIFYNLPHINGLHILFLLEQTDDVILVCLWHSEYLYQTTSNA